MEMSNAAMDELNLVMEAVRESMNMTYHAYLEDDLALARRVSPLGIVIRGLCDEMKLRHVERLSQGNCGLEEGTVFNDLLNSLNRIATHCASSMVALIKIREKIQIFIFTIPEYMRLKVTIIKQHWLSTVKI